MTVAALALVMSVALIGPALAVPRRLGVPVVVGELVAGVAIGRSGLHAVDPTDHTFVFLANLGFALVMFVAGSHVPVRDRSLIASIRPGVGRAVAVAAIGTVLGFALAVVFHTGHGALYAVLAGSSSAALVLPVVDSLGLQGTAVTQLLPQIAIADAACIVAVPLVVDPPHALRAALGALAVIACAGVLYLVLSRAESSGLRLRLHRLSEARGFALELRISLIILLALAALAQQLQVSLMLAGFSFGLVLAAIGEPKRLARQLFGLTEGFLGPLFFVWLGASLSLSDLAHRPSYLLLAVGLAGCAIAAHACMALAGQPLSLGVLAAAQLGVPVAAATLGTQLHVLHRGESAALLLGALLTVAAAAVASRFAARKSARRPASP